MIREEKGRTKGRTTPRMTPRVIVNQTPEVVAPEPVVVKKTYKRKTWKTSASVN